MQKGVGEGKKMVGGRRGSGSSSMTCVVKMLGKKT
jgi:hypothetical protein